MTTDAERDALRDRWDDIHEKRLQIMRGGGRSDDARDAAYEKHPRRPTHRVTYHPVVTIEIELAPWEEPDDFLAHYTMNLNDMLEGTDAWTEAAHDPIADRFFDVNDTEVAINGSVQTIEAIG